MSRRAVKEHLIEEEGRESCSNRVFAETLGVEARSLDRLPRAEFLPGFFSACLQTLDPTTPREHAVTRKIVLMK
jgi:hypothetical protein